MIGIINYDSGNTRSVQNALERIRVPYILTDQKTELDQCSKIIFPGVGSANAAMKALKEKDLIDWIQNCKKPFLGICLGMQLLFESSEEGNVKCLRIIPGSVLKFKAPKKIPHMGWNQISSQKWKNNYFYFIHSYHVPLNKYTIANCQYEDETFSSMVQKDNFLGMQFHPEKSGNIGQQLLSEFIHNE